MKPIIILLFVFLLQNNDLLSTPNSMPANDKLIMLKDSSFVYLDTTLNGSKIKVIYLSNDIFISFERNNLTITNVIHSSDLPPWVNYDVPSFPYNNFIQIEEDTSKYFNRRKIIQLSDSIYLLPIFDGEGRINLLKIQIDIRLQRIIIDSDDFYENYTFENYGTILFYCNFIIIPTEFVNKSGSFGGYNVKAYEYNPKINNFSKRKNIFIGTTKDNLNIYFSGVKEQAKLYNLFKDHLNLHCENN